MSYFTREASKRLCAAEDILSGRTSAAAAEPHPPSLCLRESESLPAVLELQRQLRVATGHIAELRSELAAERDARSQTLMTLGRRWREEMRVEQRNAGVESRREIAELRAAVNEQFAKDSIARAVLQRRVDDAVRAAKVRDSAQFDDRERVADEIAGLRAAMDERFAKESAARADDALRIERARESLAAQFDTEVARFADVRREAARANVSLRDELERERCAQERRVDELVGAAWRQRATALEESLRAETSDARRECRRAAELAQNAQIVAGEAQAAAKAAQRGCANRIEEQKAKMEAQCAGVAQRADGAQRKADEAADAAARAEGIAQSAKDATERAEMAAMDREARCAENAREALRAAIEHCEMFAGSAEQRAAGTAERVEACAREVAQCHAALSRAAEETETLRKRIAAVESEWRAAEECAAQRQSHAMKEAATRVEDANATAAREVEALKKTMEAQAKSAAEMSAQLQQTHEWQSRCEAQLSAVDIKECARSAKAASDAVCALEKRLAAEEKRTENEAAERDAAVQNALRRVEGLSAALDEIAQRVKDCAQERAVLRDVEDMRRSVSALDAKVRAASADAAEWHRLVDEDITLKLRALESEQRRQQHLVDRIQDEVRETKEFYEVRKTVLSPPDEKAVPVREDQNVKQNREVQEAKEFYAVRKTVLSPPDEKAEPVREDQNAKQNREVQQAKEFAETTESRKAEEFREDEKAKDDVETNSADAAWETRADRTPKANAWGLFRDVTPVSVQESSHSSPNEDEKSRNSRDAAPDVMPTGRPSAPDDDNHNDDEKESEIEARSVYGAPAALSTPPAHRALCMRPFPESSSSTTSGERPLRRGARRMCGVAVDEGEEPAAAAVVAQTNNAWNTSWDDDTTSRETAGATPKEEKAAAQTTLMGKAWGFGEGEEEGEREEKDNSHNREEMGGVYVTPREPLPAAGAGEEALRPSVATTVSSPSASDKNKPTEKVEKKYYSSFDDTTSEDED